MNKKRHFIFILFFLLLSKSYGQFNTIRKISQENIIIRQELKDTIGEKKTNQNSQNDSISSNPNTVIQKQKKKMFLHLPLLRKLFITSYFGLRKDPFTKQNTFHKGIDFRSKNDSVYSIIPGKIDNVGFDKKLGNYIRIKNKEFTIIYGHLKKYIGKKGDSISAGELIGISGNTGRSTANHLHLTIRYNGKVINPLPLIRFIENYVE